MRGRRPCAPPERRRPGPPTARGRVRKSTAKEPHGAEEEKRRWLPRPAADRAARAAAFANGAPTATVTAACVVACRLAARATLFPPANASLCRAAGGWLAPRGRPPFVPAERRRGGGRSWTGVSRCSGGNQRYTRPANQR